MKTNLIHTLIFLLISNSLYSQTKLNKIINEFQFSLNKTQVIARNTFNRNGFGLGIYHDFAPEKKLKCVLGLEYNQTNQKKLIGNYTHFSSESDVTYHLNIVSIPVIARLKYGRKIKVFFDPGIYTDIILSIQKEGTKSGISFDPITHESHNYEGKFKYASNDAPKLIAGFSLGLGFGFPIAKCDLMIIAEYKAGLNRFGIYSELTYNNYSRLSLGLKI